MVSCAEYCMFISAPGCFFMLYLGLLVSIKSETIYSIPKNTLQSSVALFIAAFVYAGFFGLSYYSKYYTIQRKENIEQWINQHDQRQVEMEQIPEQRSQAPRLLSEQIE